MVWDNINTRLVMDRKYNSIGLFIDGGYFAKIDEALDESMGLNINIPALMSMIRREVAKLDGTDVSECHVTESHYFRGRYRVNNANSKHLLYSERKFEDSLIENDFIFHYKHLKEMQKDKETVVIEKGIDVWFALEAYELSIIRKFDFVVLMTGDADHEMLVRKLKALKIQVVLLTWDVGNDGNSSTSRQLREEACVHLEISRLLMEDKNLLATLCRSV